MQNESTENINPIPPPPPPPPPQSSLQEEGEADDTSFLHSFDEKLMTIYEQMKNESDLINNENKNVNSQIPNPPSPQPPPPPPPSQTPPPDTSSSPPQNAEIKIQEIPLSIRNEIPIEELETVNDYDKELDNNTVDINEINLNEIANDVQERAQKFLEQLQNNSINNNSDSNNNINSNTRNSDRIEGLSLLSSTILDSSNEVSEMSDFSDSESLNESEKMKNRSNYYYVSPLSSFRMSTSSFTSDLSDLNLVRGKDDVDNENENNEYNNKSIKMKDESTQDDSELSFVTNPIESIINTSSTIATHTVEEKNNDINRNKQQSHPSPSKLETVSDKNVKNEDNLKMDDVLELLNEVFY